MNFLISAVYERINDMTAEEKDNINKDLKDYELKGRPLFKENNLNYY